MKYKLKTEVETEIEIELPYFFKLDNKIINPSYFAILNKNKGISNWRCEDIVVNQYPPAIASLIDSPGFEEISKEEFKISLTQTCNQIINLI
jgi:hypothetical protein